MKEQPTALEILEAIQGFAGNVDKRFDALEHRVGHLESDMTDMKSRTTRIEATMVTKDYLDDKLAEHGSRYGMLIRQTNKKIDTLTDALVSIGSLPVQVAKRISGMEPFASG